MTKSNIFLAFADKHSFLSAQSRKDFHTYIYTCLPFLTKTSAKSPFLFRKSARRLPQETLFFSARRSDFLRLLPDFSPYSGKNSSGRRDFGALFPACFSICGGESPLLGMAKRKPDDPVADAPRLLRRMGFLSRMHLSSKSRFPLTNRSGSGTRDSRICHWLPFRPKIHDARAPHLTFCKMTPTKEGKQRGIPEDSPSPCPPRFCPNADKLPAPNLCGQQKGIKIRNKYNKVTAFKKNG